MLVGRSVERRRIEDALHAARAQQSRTLLLRGEPGIGKSALLEDAVAGASDMQVLRVRGVESESELAFAGLADLVRPLLADLDGFPEAARVVLRRALALEDGTTTTFAVGQALVNLLSHASDRAPVLVIVDDLQWVDESSVEVLAFVARHLDAEGVALLAAARDDWPGRFDDRVETSVHMQGLDPAEARTLLVGAPIDPDAVAGIITETGANPLALLEIACAGARETRDGSDGGPRPIGARLQAAFGRRFDGLAPNVRGAVLVAAADDSGEIGLVLAAASTLGLTAGDLEAAELEGIVTLDAEHVDFPHPLLRAASYHGSSAPERRAAHRALAEAATGPRHEERRAWHLAAAALGPDDTAATALDAIGRAAIRRGSVTTAAKALDRAARLSTDEHDRAARLLAAGEALWMSELPARAAPLLDEAERGADDPGLRADAAIIRGQAETWLTGARAGHDRLVEAADAIAPFDPGRAVAALAYATTAAVLAADVAGARRAADRAVGLADTGDPLVGAVATLAESQALLVEGNGDRATASLDPLVDLAEQLVDGGALEGDQLLATASMLLLQVAGFADTVLERWDRARRSLALLERLAREQGLIGVLPFALATTAELDWREGRWAEAHANAAVVTDLALRSELTAAPALAQALLARVEAGLGDDAAARSHVAAALELADRHDLGAVQLWARSALGLLELGRRDFPAAADALEPVAALVEARGVGEPGIVWWRGDFIEALAGADRREEAEQQLDRFDAEARASGRQWARAVGTRCRALLSDDRSFRKEFRQALREHERLASPFERARTELAFAERLAATHPDDAAVHAGSARAVFERIGATPWLRRATELGVDWDAAAVPAVVPLRGELTARELHVATVVGQGASNREAADALFVSPKTVDFHLSNIYRKLGLRGRTELAALVARHAFA